ncbi:hypothetical protein [Embleya sp. NBC_00896]|uniref:hypothetical protein n=1 Tax=Embleya sp. NBC_00896 TaxID=2975961 RepID=UPI002F90DB8B|nr:hypothetical protein OG928_48595 [Embleya sp. NBC_00896]
METPNAPREVERLTFTEIAERIAERGYTPISKQRVAQLAHDSPDWPVPQEEWKRVGKAVQIPWDKRLDAYFATRDTKPGPRGRRSGSTGPRDPDRVPDAEVAEALGIPIETVPRLHPRPRSKKWHRADLEEIRRNPPPWVGNAAAARAEAERLDAQSQRRRAALQRSQGTPDS